MVGGWDFDFFVRLDDENEERVRRVLFEFGFSDLSKAGQRFLQRGRVFRFGESPTRIGLLSEIDGISFERAWKGRTTGELDGVPVSFICRADLIENKEASGPPKDMGDVAQLRETDLGQK